MAEKPRRKSDERNPLRRALENRSNEPLGLPDAPDQHSVLGSSSGSALVVIVGGGLAVVGSFLPWATVSAPFIGTVSKSGLEGGDGVITLILGIVTAVIGFSRFSQQVSLPRWMQRSSIVTSIVILIVGIYDLVNTTHIVSGVQSSGQGLASASVGAGLWVVVVGGGLAFFSSLSLRTELKTAPGILKCPFCAESIRADAIVCKHCGRDLPRIPCPRCKTPMQAAAGAMCPSCGLKPDLTKQGETWWTRDKQKRNFRLEATSGEWIQS